MTEPASAPVFINGRFLIQPLSGVQRYAREIVRALDRRPGAERRFVLLAPQAADVCDLGLHRIPCRRLGGGGGHLWEQTTLAWAARRGPLLSLCGAGPLVHRRQWVVIHDAAVFRHPEHFSLPYAALHRLIGRRLARSARLATVSRFSRSELAAVLNLPPERIAIVPNGADHLGQVAPDTAALTSLDLSARPYFVVLGNLAPNKNINVVIRALDSLPDPEVRLVVVGAAAPRLFDRETPARSPRVLFAGRRTDAEVAALLRHAHALVFAARYEGFGIPPLEAFAHDCPVIASDIPAVREVCGDAPYYFHPRDEAALAELMAAQLQRSPEPDRLTLGRTRAGLYSWTRSAHTLEALLGVSPHRASTS